MHCNHSSLHQTSSPGWKTLGELELTVGIDTEHTVSKWLTEVLNPLELHVDLLNKILNSAQEAASHAVQAESVKKFEHLHLLIFVPAKQTQNHQNWGFYRIEKMEKANAKANPDHAIEFYLYRE